MTCAPWGDAADVIGCDRCAEMEEGDLEPFIEAASFLLGQWTYGAFGLCTETVIPQYDCSHREMFWVGDRRVEGIRLGFFPLRSIQAIRIDGGAITLPGNVLIRDSEWVLRTDPEVWSWPTDGTIEMDITFGTEPNAAALLAFGTLACQLALACNNSDECRLPMGVQSLTRQGLNIVLQDPFSLLDNGRLGLAEVDTLLSISGEPQPAVYIPGRPAPSTITTWEAV